MKAIIIVAVLLLCVTLSMGCVNTPEEESTLNAPASIFVEEPTEEEQIYTNETIERQTKAPVPAKLVIKSIKLEDEGIVFKIKNEGGSPAEDIYFAIIGIDFNPVFDESLRWNHNISDRECKEVIDGVIKDSSFRLNTSDYGRYEDNVSGEPLHLVPLLYKDYVDVIEPGETIESNMYVYWSHDRFIKVLYDGDCNIIEYKLYDTSSYEDKGTFRGITG